MINKHTWIISDLHFEHARCHTLFEPHRNEAALKSLYNNFDDLMVERWNQKIKKDDNVLIVGDLIINKRDKIKTIKNIRDYGMSLNGNKYILFGNHDLYLRPDVYIEYGYNVLTNSIIENDKIIPIEKDYKNKFPFIIYQYEGENILISHLPANPKMPDFRDTYIDEKRILSQQVVKDFKISRNIHGHTHSNKMRSDFFINVCVDVLEDYFPRTIEQVLEKQSENSLY